MSATLRYDIGQSLFEALDARNPSAFDGLSLKAAARWGGFGNPYWHCHTFAVKLPKQVVAAWRLFDLAGEVMCDLGQSVTDIRSARTLYCKLARSLGLPRDFCFRGDPPVSGQERAFLRAIAGEPGDLASWSAYADWLLEAGEPRGELIAGWLGPRAIKVKYGVPLLAEKWGD